MDFLADSNITKRALAAAFKGMLESRPFAKISVSDICEKCEMNRKSFYYHFQDKYDLLNWIYRTEIIAVVRQKEYDNGWELIEGLCTYFYENRDFCRKTLNVDEQNSFYEYYRDIVSTIIGNDMEALLEGESMLEFAVDFYADAFIASTKRWLMSKDGLVPEAFVLRLKRCLPSQAARTGMP